MMRPSRPFISAREFATTARCAGLVDGPCHVLPHRIDIPASLFGAMITVVRSSRFGSGDILVDVENRQLRRLDAALRHDAEPDELCDAWNVDRDARETWPQGYGRAQSARTLLPCVARKRVLWRPGELVFRKTSPLRAARVVV